MFLYIAVYNFTFKLSVEIFNFIKHSGYNSIVKTVLKLHKAQFGVFSTLGKGTTFWFELIRTNKDGEPYRY